MKGRLVLLGQAFDFMNFITFNLLDARHFWFFY